jgi:hypothetical protein
MTVQGSSSEEREGLVAALAIFRSFRDLPIGQGTWATFTDNNTKLKLNSRNKLRTFLSLVATKGQNSDIKDLSQDIIRILDQLTHFDKEIQKNREVVKREVIHEMAKRHLKKEELFPQNICPTGSPPTDPDSAQYHMLATYYKRKLSTHPFFLRSEKRVTIYIESILEQKMPERIKGPETEMVAILEQIDPLLDDLIKQLDTFLN